MAMGQKPVAPVNIPIPTKLGPKMGGAPAPKWDPMGFDTHSQHLLLHRLVPRAVRIVRHLPPERTTEALQLRKAPAVGALRQHLQPVPALQCEIQPPTCLGAVDPPAKSLLFFNIFLGGLSGKPLDFPKSQSLKIQPTSSRACAVKLGSVK